MTEKTKSWIKDNIMGIILVAMFTGFVLQYQVNNAENTKAHAENTKAHKDILSLAFKMNSRQLTVCTILINDPDTDPYYREVLREWIKLETRGN